MHSRSFQNDPKHLGFVLARYKFVAKMLDGFDRVLEIGCGDCTGASLVQAVVKEWRGIDIDEELLPKGRQTAVADILNGRWLDGGLFDAIYALDVLEHISEEDRALRNIKASMKDRGTLIVGMPSLESQPFASEFSAKHHVNCKTEKQLRQTLRRHFSNVYIFGMNDETLHTGFGPMCHYRLAIAC